MTVHATAVAIGDRAVLLRGASGAGKSDVALRLLCLPDDAIAAFGVTLGQRALVADDRVLLERSGDRLVGAAPEALRGRLELRGLGILRVERWRERATIALVVDLANRVPRMPEPVEIELLGVSVPHLVLSPFEASTPLKIALALSVRPVP